MYMCVTPGGAQRIRELILTPNVNRHLFNFPKLRQSLFTPRKKTHLNYYIFTIETTNTATHVHVATCVCFIKCYK